MSRDEESGQFILGLIILGCAIPVVVILWKLAFWGWSSLQ